MEIAERFINYTKFDTQSVDESETVPSNPKQLIFARYLKEELEKEGLKEVEMDEKGYIYATLPANTDKAVPTIGFIAHYDTALDASGANIKARIVKGYDGATSSCLRALSPRRRCSPSCSPTRVRTSSSPTAPRCWAPTTRPALPRSSRPCAGCATIPR